MADGFLSSVISGIGNIASGFYGVMDDLVGGLLPNFDPGEAGGVTFGSDTPYTGYASGFFKKYFPEQSTARSAAVAYDYQRKVGDIDKNEYAGFSDYLATRGKTQDEYKSLLDSDITSEHLQALELKQDYENTWVKNKTLEPGQTPASKDEANKKFFDLDLETVLSLAGIYFGLRQERKAEEQAEKDRAFAEQRAAEQLELQRQQLLMNQAEMALRADLERQKLAIQQQQVDQRKGGAAVSRAARNVFSG